MSGKHPTWLAAMVLVISACSGSTVVSSPSVSPAEVATTAPTVAAPTATAVLDSPATSVTPTGLDSASTASASSEGCTYLGLDESGWVEVELEFTNPVLTLSDLSVVYALFDSDGEDFMRDETYAIRAVPDEAMRFRSLAGYLPERLANDNDITCRIVEYKDRDLDDDALFPAAGHTCAIVETSTAGHLQVEVNATSPYTYTSDVQMLYKMSANGVRFGSGFAFARDVEAGQLARARHDKVVDMPAWVSGPIACAITRFGNF